jgi:hypothetical protein
VADVPRIDWAKTLTVELTVEQACALNDFYRRVELELDGTPAGDGFERVGDTYRAHLQRLRRAQGVPDPTGLDFADLDAD